MFSTSIGRVARSSAASTCHNSLIARCPATAAAAASSQLTAVSARQADRSHQRRHSSSKASIPPDGNKRTPSKEREVAGASSGRVGRRKSKSDAGLVGLSNNRGRSQPFSKQYPNLPIVPSTQHLHPSDVEVSSFFSCHRPISVTAAVPVASTEKSFNAIFEPRVKPAHGDVIFTLNNFVENIEGHQSANDGNLFGTVQEEGPAVHLDGTPATALDRLVQSCRPFRPPPPPQPFDEFAVEPKTKKAVKKARAVGTKQKRRSWSTTIIVTETIDPSGEKSYQAASTPIVRIPSPKQRKSILAEVAQMESQRPASSQPFLRRMLARSQQLEQFRASRRQGKVISDARDMEPGREEGLREPSFFEQNQQPLPVTGQKPSMLLISVKRQRKLKMKKHKYKKLMKRTRNLRRRLGKL